MTEFSQHDRTRKRSGDRSGPGSGPTAEDTTGRAASLRHELAQRREVSELLAEAGRLRDQAVAEADQLVGEAQDVSERLVTEARERADGILSQARAEAARLTTIARGEAEGMRRTIDEEVRRAREEARTEAVQEMTLLRLRAEQLVSDVESNLDNLDTMLDGARSAIAEARRGRAALAEAALDLVAAQPPSPADEPHLAARPAPAAAEQHVAEPVDSAPARPKLVPEMPAVSEVSEVSEMPDATDASGPAPAVLERHQPAAAFADLGDFDEIDEYGEMARNGVLDDLDDLREPPADRVPTALEAELAAARTAEVGHVASPSAPPAASPVTTPAHTSAHTGSRPLGWLFRGE